MDIIAFVLRLSKRAAERGFLQVSAVVLTALIVACGPSQAEKEEIAAVTCAVIDETWGVGAAAFRVEKVNEARQRVGGRPFLEGDDEILRALWWGHCELLILAPESYHALEHEREQHERQEEYVWRMRALQAADSPSAPAMPNKAF